MSVKANFTTASVLRQRPHRVLIKGGRLQAALGLGDPGALRGAFLSECLSPH